MEFYEDGDDIVSMVTPSHYYQSWIDTLHGGLQATMLDEICGWVITRKLQTTGVTTNLDIRYKHAVKTTDKQLTLRARLVEMRRNLAIVEAELQDSEGKVCSSAKATYFTVSPEKAKETGFKGCFLEGEE